MASEPPPGPDNPRVTTLAAPKESPKGRDSIDQLWSKLPEVFVEESAAVKGRAQILHLGPKGGGADLLKELSCISCSIGMVEAQTPVEHRTAWATVADCYIGPHT